MLRGDPPAPRVFALSARETLYLGLAAAAHVAVAYLTTPTYLESQDLLKLHLINKVFAAEAVRSGGLPLWNPHVGLGRPFLADIETAFFYPPNLLHLVLPPGVAIALLSALHLALAAASMRWLGGYLGMAGPASWIAGGSFATCGYVYGALHTGQVPFVQAAAYLPLLVLLAALWQDTRSRRALCGLALALALQLLSGHPQMSWLCWVGLAAFLAGRSPGGSRADSARRAIVGLLGLASALAWAFCIAAVQMLPFLELQAQGNRSSPSLGFSSIGPLSWLQWITLVAPAVPVRPIAVGDSLQVGALVLLAGLCGALQVRRRDVRALWLVLTVGILIAAGQQTPLFGWLYEIVPGLSAFRLHGRAAILVVFALTVWAGMTLSEGRPGPAHRVVAWSASGVIVLALSWWYGSFVPSGEPRLVPWALHSALALGAALLLHAAPHQEASSRRSRLWWGLASLVIVVDVGLSTASVKRFYLPSGPYPAEAAVDRVLRQSGLYKPGDAPPRISVPYLLVRDNAGMLYGWSTFSGYVALSLDRVWTVLHATFDLPLDPETFPSIEIFEHGPFPYPSMSLALGLDPRDGRLVVRSNPDPRAYLAHAIRRVADWKEAARLLAAGHDPHEVALVEGPVAGFPDSREPGRSGRAEIVRFSREEVAVRTTSERRALLVLAEAWYPGWQATIDGARAPCSPVNAWMRGVMVPAGAHEVRFRFRSRWLGWGVALSALGLGLLLALGWRSGGWTPRADEHDLGSSSDPRDLSKRRALAEPLS
jgi:hypothetical protein